MISTKWTNIRDRYIKYLKKLEDEKKTGSKAKSIRKYIYSDNMSFLQKNTKRKETVSSAVEEEEHEEISRDIPTLSDPQPSTSTQGKGKRQKTLVTDIEKSIFKKLQEPEDRHVSFFKGILPSLQKFDDTESLEFQSGVIKIIQSIHRSRQTPKGPVWPVPSEHAIQPSPHMHSYYPDHVKHTHTHWRYSPAHPPNVGNSSPATQPGITVPPTTAYSTPLHSPHSVQSSTSAYSGEHSQFSDLDFALEN